MIFPYKVRTMQSKFLLLFLVLTPFTSVAMSIPDNYLLVQIEEYKLDNVKRTVESRNIIASWVIRKTDDIKNPLICSTMLSGFLDSNKTKNQNVLRLREMLTNSKGVTKLFSDSKSTVNAIKLSRKKAEEKIKNIDEFNYSVNCLEISPNSELDEYFSY